MFSHCLILCQTAVLEFGRTLESKFQVLPNPNLLCLPQDRTVNLRGEGLRQGRDFIQGVTDQENSRLVLKIAWGLDAKSFGRVREKEAVWN